MTTATTLAPSSATSLTASGGLVATTNTARSAVGTLREPLGAESLLRQTSLDPAGQFGSSSKDGATEGLTSVIVHCPPEEGEKRLSNLTPAGVYPSTTHYKKHAADQVRHKT